MGLFAFSKTKDSRNSEDKKKNKILQKAQKLARKGQIDKAVSEWESLLKKKADDATIYNTIGDLYLKGRRREQAIDAYQKASSIFTNSGFALKAIAVNKKILKLDPKNLDALTCMAQLNRERGMVNNAKECYLSIASYHLKTGSHDQALEAYQHIVDMDPKNLKIKIGLADLYLKEKMIKDGSRIYGEVISAFLEQDKFDEAEQLCRKGDEANISSAEITGFMAEIHLAKGELEKAQECCRKLGEGGSSDPTSLMLQAEILVRQGDVGKGMELLQAIDRRSLTEHGHIKIYRFLLEVGEYGQAFDALHEVFDKYASAGRFEELLQLYQKILDRDPNNLRVRQKIIDLSSKLKRRQDVVLHYKEMGRIYTDAGEVEKAKNIYEQVLDQAPGDQEVQARLRELGGGTSPEYGEVALDGAEEPTKTVTDETEQKTHAVDEDIEVETFETAAAAPAAPQKKEVESKAAADETGERSKDGSGDEYDEEEATRLGDNITEADVYIKYGHLGKAITHLRKNLEIDPNHVTTYERLLQIFVEQGDIPEQVDTLLTLSSLYQAAGDLERYEKALNEIIALDPGNQEAQRRLEEGPTALASSALDGRPTETEDLTFKFDVEKEATEEAAETGAAVSAQETKTGEGSINEMIEEADFYKAHGMLDEAKAAYEKILSSHPDRSDIVEKLRAITGERVAAPSQSEDTEPVASAERSGQEPSDVAGDFVDFADELRKEFDSASTETPQTGGGESVDAGDADDFTAELRREVEQSIVSDGHVFGENDVMNIFNEFREGVQQELGDEDHETHYNLGIAYMEMGLIDEAAEEFVTASSDPKRVMDCITMIGLCHIQKGRYAEALAELQKGLDLEGRTEDEYIGVRYEIAKVCELSGDNEGAKQQLLKIHESHPAYRDVPQKLEALGVKSQDLPRGGVVSAIKKDDKVSYI